MILDKIEKLLDEVQNLNAHNAEEIEALRLKYLSKKGEKLLQNKSKLHGKYTALLQNKEFVTIITNGTAKIPNVQNRYRQIKNIFQEVLDDDSIYANRKF